MPMSANPNLLTVDWSKIPAPIDDGAARHLEGVNLPDIALPATDGSDVSLARRTGRVVVFAYPRTGDHVPVFRDLHGELVAAGAAGVFGLSTQDTGYQLEAATRLHLPFSLLSDAKLMLTKALRLPTMEVAGLTLLKRLALIIDDGRIAKVFYPVFPPDRNAADVRGWLLEHQRQ